MNEPRKPERDHEIRARLESHVLGELSGSERRDVDRQLAASPELRREYEAVRRIVAAARSEPVPPLSSAYRERRALLIRTLFQPRESAVGRLVLGAFSTMTYLRVRFRTSPGFRVLVVAAAAQAAVILILVLWGIPRSSPIEQAPDGTRESVARSAPGRLQDGPLEEELPQPPDHEDLSERIRVQPETERASNARGAEALLVWGHGTPRHRELFRNAVRTARTDQAQRMALVFRHGGGLQTEDAVKRGLDWLIRGQHETGWFGAQDHRADPSARSGDTALATLALLGRGLSEEVYQKSAERALGYLLDQQRQDGSWGEADRSGEPRVDARAGVHDALATQALLEGAMMGVGKIPADALQRALAHLQANRPEHPAEAAEAAKALLLAQSLGYAVDSQSVNRHLAWFREPENQRRFGGSRGAALSFHAGQKLLDSLTLARTGPGSTPSAGLESWLDVDRPSSDVLLGWLHMSHALIRGQDTAAFARWNQALVRRLAARQDPDGRFRPGPKSPDSVPSTAASVLLLETYYRYGAL